MNSIANWISYPWHFKIATQLFRRIKHNYYSFVTHQTANITWGENTSAAASTWISHHSQCFCVSYSLRMPDEVSNMTWQSSWHLLPQVARQLVITCAPPLTPSWPLSSSRPAALACCVERTLSSQSPGTSSVWRVRPSPRAGTAGWLLLLLSHSELAVTFQGKRGVCEEGSRCSNGKCQSVTVTITKM